MTIEQQILKLVKQADPINPLGYVRHILRQHSREKLDQNLGVFLNKEGAYPFYTVLNGNTDADLLVINSMAHQDQVSLGERVPAMEGTTAKEDIEKVLVYSDFDLSKVAYFDAINYVAHDIIEGVPQKHSASQQEVEDARPFVTSAIEIVQPKAILLLGAQAANMFNKGFALKDSAGEMRHHGNIPMMSIYHPDYFRHMSGKKSEAELNILRDNFVAHIQKLLKKSNLI